MYEKKEKGRLPNDRTTNPLMHLAAARYAEMQKMELLTYNIGMQQLAYFLNKYRRSELMYVLRQSMERIEESKPFAHTKINICR